MAEQTAPLFDIKADPYETTDLWDDANATQLARKNALEAMINAIPNEY